MLKWSPGMRPSAQAMVRTIRSKVSEALTKPMPKSGKTAARMAALELPKKKPEYPECFGYDSLDHRDPFIFSLKFGA